MSKKITVVLIACLASLLFWPITSADNTAIASATGVEANSPAPSFLFAASDYDASTDLLAFLFAPTTNLGCQYTCPNGNAMFCPDVIDMTVECINNCCVYC